MRWNAIRLLAWCAAAWTVAAGAPRAQAPATAASSALRGLVDVQALDTSGRPVLDLKAEDLAVTVDGQPRAVRSVRYVYQGAGAEEAARNGPTTVAAAAVPARAVILAVDENTIRRGREKAVTSAGWRVVDSLTPTDMIGVIALPRPRGTPAITADRGPLRPALNGITGQARTVELQPPTVSAGPTPDPADLSEAQQIERAQRPDAPSSARSQDPDASIEGTADGADSVRTLRSLLAGLQNAPGPKALVYITGGDGRPDAASSVAQSRQLRELVDVAALARTSVHVIHVPDRDGQRPDSALQQLATDTAGTFTTVTSKRADLSAFTASLGGRYVVELEASDADRPDRVVSLAVGSPRPGVRVIAGTRWCVRTDAPPEPVARPLPAPMPTSSRTEAKPGPPAERSPVRDADLDVVLARVGRYVDTYLKELGSVVAEESYLQVVRRGNTVVQSRKTRADILLLQSDYTWIPFRDVFEVDGKPVRDREDRLKKLFLENPGQAMVEGQRISEESARYNVGLVYRTINTPNVAISFLQSSLLSSFRFERRGPDTIDGVPLLKVDYEETARPTLIRQGKTGADLPSKGSVWVEPVSGRVVRTLLKNGDTGTTVEVTVRYEPNDAIGLWTPMRMEERYWSASGRRESISTEATYSGFRRFQVDTDEAVTPVK